MIFCFTNDAFANNRAFTKKTGDGDSEARNALIIGNSNYATAPLKNPVNDAKGMADVLREKNFTVNLLLDADLRTMEKAISRFGKMLQKGGVGLFFYAGHGMQVKGINYLIPIGANITEEDEIRFESVNAGRIMAKMESAGNPLNMIFLDACRDNPFARSFRSSSRGLAMMDAPSGTLVSFATAPGKTASDGTGTNGLFTGHLLRQMEQPGLELTQMMKRVRRNVMQDSSNQQTPWGVSSLTGDFYFSGQGKTTVVASGTAVTETAGKGGIKVDTQPTGAKIYINQVFEGNSPITLNFTPGVYTVLAKKNGFKNQQESVRVRTNRSISLNLIMNRSGGSIFVRSEPENAKIYLNNVFEDYAPNTISGLKAGSYNIIVKLDGYQDFSKSVYLSEGQEQQLQANLKEIPKTPATWREPATGMEFVFVKGGCYQMGDTFSEGGSDKKPVHEVCVDDYYLGKYEVTQGEWQKMMGNNPSGFKNGSNYPVEKVSWTDTQNFIQKLNHQSNGNYRLPTEAEWEYACREGGRKVRFGNGKDIIGPNEANFNGSSKYKKSYSRSGQYRKRSTEVGAFQPNALGLYDMSGNVWEWVSDWYDKSYYSNSTKNNPTGPGAGSTRVVRGGSWYRSPRNLRCAVRDRSLPSDRDYDLGFRLLRTP